MKIVVDTNIIFSALLNSNSTIGELIFNSDRLFEFYSCSYMRYEIRNHWEKLKKLSKLSKLSEEQLQTSYQQLLISLKFINEEIIPTETWLAANGINPPLPRKLLYKAVNPLEFVAPTFGPDQNSVPVAFIFPPATISPPRNSANMDHYKRIFPIVHLLPVLLVVWQVLFELCGV